jgi:hypothetical protein
MMFLLSRRPINPTRRNGHNVGATKKVATDKMYDQAGCCSKKAGDISRRMAHIISAALTMLNAIASKIVS